MTEEKRHFDGESSPRVNGDGGVYAKCRPVAPHLGDVLNRGLDKEVEGLKGQPWEKVYLKIHLVFVAAGRECGASPENQRSLEMLLRATLTAFLEKLGADPRQCENPAQALLYFESTRRDFIMTGAAYLGEFGGEGAARAEIARAVKWQQFLDLRDSGDQRAKAIWAGFADLTANHSSEDKARLQRAMLQDDGFKSDRATLEDYQRRPYDLAKQIGLEASRETKRLGTR